MCCARTAALQGGTKSRSNCQHGFPAAINAFVWPSEHDSMKKQRLGGSETLSGKAQPLQNPPPGAKIGPRGGPEKLRYAQEALKRVQEPPNSVQKATKLRPRAAQDSPRPLQNRARRVPKRVFSIVFDGTCVWQAVSRMLCCFFCFCVKLAICKKHRKT